MIAKRDLHYLSKDDQETYERIAAKDEITEEEYETLMSIQERLEHTIAESIKP